MTPELQLLFQGIARYASLSEEAFEDMATRAQLISVGKNHVLVKTGEISDRLFFIIKGSVRAFTINEQIEFTDWFAFENQFIAPIISLLTQVPSPHTLESMEPTTLLWLTRKDMDELGKKHHSFETLAKMVAYETLVILQQNVVAQRFNTAKIRYLQLLEQQPEIIQRVPLRHVASYLGIAQETLSRIRAEI